MEQSFCSLVAAEMGEPLSGTAKKASLWCLLAYTDRWDEQAVRNSSLPPEVLAWFADAERRYSGFRSQFIKQQEPLSEDIPCFFAITTPERRQLYRFQLTSYLDLLQIDLTALLADPLRYEVQLVEEPLLLVCTHGKHNLCCAKFGLPIYSELARLVGEQAWQTTHLGGDQFAANLLVLPAGIYYGRVTTSDLPGLVEASRNKQVYLPTYRGQCVHKAIVQAADAFLRQQTGELKLDAFALTAVQKITSSLSVVIFADQRKHQWHRLEMEVESKEITSSSICKGVRTRKVDYYRLQSYHMELFDPAIVGEEYTRGDKEREERA